MNPSDTFRPDWSSILRTLIDQPGKISECYRAFHSYSLRNQTLAMWQLEQIGPIATFKGWLAKGRCVTKGSRAIALCMPVMVKAKPQEGGDGSDVEPGGMRRVFIYKRGWFSVHQTVALPVEPGKPAPVALEDVVPARVWDKARAMEALRITEEPFTSLDGNSQGYASGRSIAINPVAWMPWKTTFHEMAHVLMHTSMEPGLALAADSPSTPRSLREVEAEGVAYLCCQSLGLPGAEESRGYAQSWLKEHGTEGIPDKSAAKIIATAEKILAAGAPPKPAKDTEGNP